MYSAWYKKKIIMMKNNHKIIIKVGKGGNGTPHPHCDVLRMVKKLIIMMKNNNKIIIMTKEH